MFGTKDLLSLISDVGLVPTILLVGVALFFLHKEIKKSLSGLGSSIDKLRESSSASISRLRDDMESDFRQLKAEIEERNIRQDVRMDAIEKELKFIGREYVSKEQHFSDTEGWKANLDSLRRDLGEIPIKMITIIKEMKA